MNDLIKELENMGCDIEETMERFLDNVELYFDCLDKAINDTAFEDLKKALDEKDTSLCFSSAHTIKGLMSNMGLVPVYNEVVEIVEPLRTGGHDEELLMHYENMMKEVEKIKEISEKYKRGKEAC